MVTKLKMYKLINFRKEKEIEDTINELATDGWEVKKFGISFNWKQYYALMVKET